MYEYIAPSAATVYWVENDDEPPYCCEAAYPQRNYEKEDER